jgi:hypothetical protein
LARKEGWAAFVNAVPRQRPESLTRSAIRALGDAAANDYNLRRREWHANLGPLKTPQLAALHEDLWDILDSNLQDGDKAKGAVAIDSAAGLGKTTAALAFGKDFHLREVAERGPRTAEGDERWPVCRVGLTGNTTMKDFNLAMLEFFAHPGVTRGTAAQYIRRALDCVLLCDVRLLIVDDLHFLRWRLSSGVEISNHLKYIANDYLQLNRNRLQRVRRALEIPGIAWWTGLPSVIHHGTGGSDAGAARADAGHRVRVVDCAR